MKPLEDIRIIALEQHGAGPFGSVHLADLGADVIKIEDPATGGDIGRHVPPCQASEDSLFFEAVNRSKRSRSLGPGTAGGRAVFEDLVRVSNVQRAPARPEDADHVLGDLLSHSVQRVRELTATGAFGQVTP